MKSRPTQKERILQYLKDFKTITTLECVYRMQIVDPQHIIMELRREGYKITDTWEQGEYNKYKRYKLEED